MNLSAALILASAAHAQTNQPPQEYSAFAINMGAYTAGTTANLIMRVNRWSTQEQREKLFAVLKKDGMREMLEVLRDMKPVGNIRTAGNVGYDLHLALQEPLEGGGRRILLATDRPLGFAEAINRPPSVEYPFTVIEMTIPPEGPGKGTMSVAARFVPAGKTVIVENWDTQPVQLNQIQVRDLK